MTALTIYPEDLQGEPQTVHDLEAIAQALAGIGVAGVNWNVQIMGLKFLSSGGGGSTDDAVEAVNYATMMRKLYMDSSRREGYQLPNQSRPNIVFDRSSLLTRKVTR